jgi:hypothetical protein
MEGLAQKVLRVVDSCVTSQQLEVAETYAVRARRRVNMDQWLDIESLIHKKANQIIFWSPDDGVLLGRAWSRL